MRRSQHARKETEFLRLKRTRLGLEDFESLKVIGRGAFGEVSARPLSVLWPLPPRWRVDALVIGWSSSPPGPSGAEKGHRSRLCNEDPPQSGHAGEGAGRVRARRRAPGGRLSLTSPRCLLGGSHPGRAGHPGGGRQPVGGQNVLQFPGQNEPLPHHGVPAWRYLHVLELHPLWGGGVQRAERWWAPASGKLEIRPWLEESTHTHTQSSPALVWRLGGCR